MTIQKLVHADAFRGKRGQIKVLRAVATVEVSKGIVVLLTAIAVLWLLDKDTSDIAYGLLRLLHISPDHRFARAFLRWADTLTDRKLWAIAAVAMTYSTLRFVEAYGLWGARPWAEWVALVSGALYVPIEIREIIRRPTTFHFGLLIGNIAVVLYMAYLRWQDHKARGMEASSETPAS